MHDPDIRSVSSMVQPAGGGESPRSVGSESSESISGQSSPDLTGLELRVSDVALGAISAPKAIIRVDLDELALRKDGGIGYKAANLVQLEHLAKALGFVVPPFNPLSHNIIMQHILKKYPEFHEDYGRFLESFSASGVLDDELKGMLARIRAGIMGACSEENPLEVPGLREWIESRGSDFLIVRSTGEEDGKISNPGGNLSISSTPKELGAVSVNVGKVVASYFSEGSFAQRIALGDESVKTKVPFVPVLIQEEVAERLGAGGKTPSSAVMLITEDGITISSGLGHPEGITSASVPADTSMASHGPIRHVIRKKTTRMRPERTDSGSIECRVVPCKGKEVTDSALTGDQEERLQLIAKGLVSFLGEKRLDVEVTTDERGIPVAVQNRPLVIATPEKPPSYVIVEGEHFLGETIVSGGCYVRNIENKHQAVVCGTITEAKERYQKLSLDAQREVKAIIIYENAPKTSHEAVFFTALGLPVLQLDKKFEIEFPCALDPQQGLIAKSGAEYLGYFCHPMPMQLSLIETNLVKAMHMQMHETSPSRGRFIRRELTRLQADVGEEVGPRISTLKQMRECLEKMKTEEDPKVAELVLNQVIQCIYRQIQEVDITPKSRMELIMVLENLLDIKKRDPLSGEARTLRRLYTVRLVEACLFQTGEGIIGGFSYSRSLRDIVSQRKGSLELVKPHSEETLQNIPFIKMKNLILNEKMQGVWMSVISHLDDISEELKVSVRDLFLSIDSLGSATEFMNVTISYLLEEFALDEDPHDIEKISSFFISFASLEETLGPTLKKAHELQEFLLEESVNISAWSDPKHIEKNIERISKRIEKLGFCHDGIERVFISTNSDGKLILAQSIKQVVECYDKIIKSCTGSKSYVSDKAKAMDFLQLLRPYGMMSESIRELAGRDGDSIRPDYRLPLTLETISEEDASEILKISPGFDVSELLAQYVKNVARSFTISDIVHAISLEDKFTLLHQTMLQDLSRRLIVCGFTKEILPDNLASFANEIIKEDSEFRKLNDIFVEGKFINFELGIPLRDHGATLLVKYDRVLKTIQITCSLFGGNENDRWKYIDQLAQIMCPALNLTIIKDVQKETSLKLEFSTLFDKRGFTNSIKLINNMFAACFTIADYNGLIKPSILEILPKEFQTEEIILTELARDGLLLEHISRPFLENEHVVITAISQNLKALKFLPFDLHKKDFVLSILRINGKALKYIDPELLKDSVIIDTAIDNNPEALKFVPYDLQTEDMGYRAASKRRYCLGYAAPKFQSKILARLEKSPPS